MKFIAGMITSTIFIAILFISCWLYFDFPISTNDEQQQNTPIETSTESLEQDNTQEQQAPATIPAHEMTQNEGQPKHLPNLHDKQKAIDLMKQERSSLSDEDKQIYDGVIETAKTNINNNVGTHEDYNILNTYKK